MSETLSLKRSARVALSLSLLLGACSKDNGSEVADPPVMASPTSLNTNTSMVPEPKPTTIPEKSDVYVPFESKHCTKFNEVLPEGAGKKIIDPAGIGSYAINNLGGSHNSLATIEVLHTDPERTTRYIYDFGSGNFNYIDGSSAHIDTKANAADFYAVDVSGWTCI
jgi:hypothetical protein